MKLSIIVPVFNEEKTVSQVLDKLLKLDLLGWSKEIIVIDDCSTDGSEGKLRLYEPKIKVVTHPKNLGKGRAIRTGINLAKGDYIIIQDADLEYSPKDIRSLLVVAQNNPSFVIYGSRFRGRHEDTVFGHKAGNLFLTFLTNLLYGSSISDMETCYKLIPRKYLERLSLSSNRFNFEPEITAKLLKMKVGILEVPINYRKRGFWQGKKISWWRDGIMAVWTLLKYRI